LGWHPAAWGWGTPQAWLDCAVGLRRCFKGIKPPAAPRGKPGTTPVADASLDPCGGCQGSVIGLDLVFHVARSYSLKDQRGEHSAAGAVHAGPWLGLPQHGDLMTQDEQLGVLRCRDRPRRTSHPVSRAKIRYSKRIDTADHHARRPHRICIRRSHAVADFWHPTGPQPAHGSWRSGRRAQVLDP
jgi:hypothetical protein